MSSYDDRHVLEAVRVRCGGCGIEYDMTQIHGPRTVCIDCRWTTMTKEDWYASAAGRSMCRRCGECPPGVQEIADARGVQNYCSVCGHAWWVQGGPLTAAAYRAGRAADQDASDERDPGH